MEAPPLQKLIWISINPIMQLLIVGGIGVWLARSKILTPVGAKIMSQVYINALVPSLMFSKMSVAVNPDSLRRMAVVIPFVFIYMGIGLIGGIIVRRLFQKRLPDAFNYALIVASTWSNWGDIPLAVILNFTSLPPFEPKDGDLGVAYVSVFLIIFTVTLFPLGGHKLVEKDFKGDKQDVEIMNSKAEEQEVIEYTLTNISSGHNEYVNNNNNEQINQYNKSQTTINLSIKAKFYKTMAKISAIVIAIATPVNIGIVSGLIVGLTPLKPIFVPFKDNQYNVVGISPPLYVIFTTTQFLGGACIPVGLLNLGAGLATLEIKSVPISLTLVVAFIKLILTPLIGIPLVRLCITLDWISKEEKVLQLVLMFASCVPSATTTLILTQYYNPTGEARHISSLLVIQYGLGFFTMIIALAVSNYLIFT
ncbi:hypothetical protein K502DRAFT_343806 [Neoconidiobolus thromboides FSU 785]|nr:hypothetical protein K502DRAFT_343806 [Neoconidiobolus thromboides FSU 785]